MNYFKSKKYLLGSLLNCLMDLADSEPDEIHLPPRPGKYLVSPYYATGAVLSSGDKSLPSQGSHSRVGEIKALAPLLYPRKKRKSGLFSHRVIRSAFI